MSKEDDGYSPFEKDCSMSLNSHLRMCKVTELYVGGLATDYCVKDTCLDAVKLGYKTYLLIDACKAVNLKPGDGAFAIEGMRRAGVKFTATEELLR